MQATVAIHSNHVTGRSRPGAEQVAPCAEHDHEQNERSNQAACNFQDQHQYRHRGGHMGLLFKDGEQTE